MRRFQLAGYRVHPLANLFPPHTDAKQAELTDDIRKRGQRRRAVLYDGKILDGRGRAKACDQLGVDLETEDYTGDDPLGEVLSLNLHRRDLTAADRRKVVAAALKIDPALSDRSLAKKTGVSDKTVAAVREELESTAEIPQLESRKGKDGKTRSRPTKPAPTPQERLAAFADDLEKLVKHVGEVIVPIQLFLRGSGELFPDLKATEVHDWLGEAASDLRQALELVRAGM